MIIGPQCRCTGHSFLVLLVQMTTHGVPQGSVLGPILFNLYINDICNIPVAKKVLFADDTVLYVSDPCFDTCVEKMNFVIDKLSLWLNQNRLVANIEKTKLMLFTPRKSPQLPILFFNGTGLEWVSHIKYLGMIIDRNLNFTIQTQDICKKLSTIRGIIYALSKQVPQNILLNIYNTLAYPLLIQNIIIWGGIPKTHALKISVMMNKILRLILGVKFNENNIPLMNTDAMYKELNLLKFHDVYRYFLLRFVHFMFFNRIDIFLDNFSKFLPSNSHNTRNSRINLPPVRRDIGKRFTIFKCCELIRNLPEDLLKPQSIASLKRKFKQMAIATY